MKTNDLLNHLNQLKVKPETMSDVMTAHALKLEDWKESAMTVLSEFEAAWEAAGKPGQLGSSKAASLREYILSNRPS